MTMKAQPLETVPVINLALRAAHTRRCTGG